MHTGIRRSITSITLLTLTVVLAAACSAARGAPAAEPIPVEPTLAYAPTLSTYFTIIGSPKWGLVELVKQGTVSVDISAVSIDTMTLHITSHSGVEEQVGIPAGTFFLAKNPATQNMVVRHSYRGNIPAGGTLDVVVDIACANLHLAEPTEQDTFTLSPDVRQPGLLQLLYTLDRNRASYTVEQAAIWIVTDNATYDQLGMLVGDSRAGPSLIGADEAVRAMQLVDEARVQLRRYAIWYQRDELAAAVTTPELKDWLTQRAFEMEPGEETSEFAVSASGTSEIDARGSARMATGRPDATACQEEGGAWGSAHDQSTAMLRLIYRQPVIPSQIVIYHSFHANAVRLVELVDIVGNRHAVYEGEPAAVQECPYRMSIDVTTVKAPVAYIELTLEQEATGWDKIDAVELMGREP